MIKIEKGSKPSDLQPADEEAKKWLAAYRKTTGAKKSQKLQDFFDNPKLALTSDKYGPALTKQSLFRTHYGKCAFCESRLCHDQYGDIEHFRPKKEVRHQNSEGQLEKESDGYFFLAFDWDNLFLSCGLCNQMYKRNFFPILPENLAKQGESAAVFKRTDADSTNLKETSVLLNPGSEDPRVALRFDATDGYARPFSSGGPDKEFTVARAGVTIKLLGLNRTALVERRLRHLMQLQLLFMCAINEASCLLKIIAIGKRIESEAMLYTDWKTLKSLFLDIPEAAKPKVHGQAMTLLAWAVHPSAEYSSLAIDAVCAWSLTLYQQPAQPANASVANQAPGNAQSSVSGTDNLKILIPGMLTALLTKQEHDYTKVLETYLKERNLEEESSNHRSELYAEMNSLIVRFSESWTALKNYSNLDPDYFKRKALPNIFSDFIEGVRLEAESVLNELKDEKETRAIIEKRSLIEGALRDNASFLNDLELSKDFNEASKFVSSNSKRLEKNLDAALPADIKANVRASHQQTLKDAYKKRDEIESDDDSAAGAEFNAGLEDLSSDLEAIMADLTLLLFEFREAGLYSKTVRDREEPLRDGVSAALTSLQKYHNEVKAGKNKPTLRLGKQPKMKPMAIRGGAT